MEAAMHRLFAAIEAERDAKDPGQARREVIEAAAEAKLEFDNLQ